MRSKKGFLLLEVMVSIVIITGGLLFVMQVYSGVKNAIVRSRELFISSLLLEEKIFDFEERGYIIEGELSGSFPDTKGYLWQTRAQPVSIEDPEILSGLALAEFTVFSEKRPEEDRRSIFTYLAKEK